MGRLILIVSVYLLAVLLIVMLVGCLDVYLHATSSLSRPRRRPPPPPEAAATPTSVVPEDFDVQIRLEKFVVGDIRCLGGDRHHADRLHLFTT